jgi:hypothetical protein
MGKKSLIYVKNYQALNSLISENQQKVISYRSQLQSFIGKPITVFVDSGGASGRGFTGILIEVLSDSIKLVTSSPSAPGNRSGYPCKKKQHSRFGTCTTIVLEHVTAITYNFV